MEETGERSTADEIVSVTAIFKELESLFEKLHGKPLKDAGNEEAWQYAMDSATAAFWLSLEVHCLHGPKFQDVKVMAPDEAVTGFFDGRKA